MYDEEMGKTQSNSPKKSSSTREFESIQTPGSSEPLEETHTTKPSTEKVIDKPKPKRFRSALGLIAGLIVFLALGALGGVQSGLNTRQDKEQLNKAVEAVAQFELGKIDLDTGQCDIARQRFEYVIQLDPGYPGVAEKLAQSMLCAGISTELSVLPTVNV